MKFGRLERDEINFLLKDRPHLKPLFTNTYNIPERLKEYDPELFVVFNLKNERYEIHSKDGGETTYNATSPYKQLDERTLRYVKRNDIRVHGMKVFDRINESERKAEERKKKDEKNFTVDFAKEFQSAFAKDSWIS